MKKYLIVAALLFVPAWSVSVQAENDVALGKIGNTRIMQMDLERMINNYDEDRRKMLENNPKNQINLVKRYIQAAVISRIARDKGFDKKPEVKEQMEEIANDFLAVEYINREIAAKINVTGEDISLYYRIHKAEFMTPETIKARHILIAAQKASSEEDRKKAKEKAGEVLKRVRAGEDFAKLAQEFSDDPGSKDKGGDLGFFQKGRMLPEFEKTAFSSKPGTISDIIETQFGYHIIKVEEKKESVPEPLDKVRDKVKERVFMEFKKARIEEFIDKALKDADAEIYPKNFVRPGNRLN